MMEKGFRIWEFFLRWARGDGLHSDFSTNYFLHIENKILNLQKQSGCFLEFLEKSSYKKS